MCRGPSTTGLLPAPNPPNQPPGDPLPPLNRSLFFGWAFARSSIDDDDDDADYDDEDDDGDDGGGGDNEDDDDDGGDDKTGNNIDGDCTTGVLISPRKPRARRRR